MTTPRDVVLRAVERELGDANDNLARARSAFDGTDLSLQYGQSGLTRGQILDEYNQRKAEAEAAKRWLLEWAP